VLQYLPFDYMLAAFCVYGLPSSCPLAVCCVFVSSLVAVCNMSVLHAEYLLWVRGLSGGCLWQRNGCLSAI